MSDAARVSYYEGMFLFPQAMSARLDDAIAHINTLLERCGGELVAMQKWGERPLAYPIDSHRRGIYILTYFKCDRSKLVDLERDCNLSETLLRSLVTRADHLTIEEIEAFDQREDLHVEAKLRRDQAESPSKTPAPKRAPATVKRAVAEKAEPATTATAVAEAEPEKPEAASNDS